MSGELCQHSVLQTSCSSWATEIGFHQATTQQLITAAKNNHSHSLGKNSEQKSVYNASCFPAPLVLPGDALASKSTAKKQSFRSWKEIEYRVRPTKRRNTIYLAPVPRRGAEHICSWAHPQQNRSRHTTTEAADIANVVVRYLNASFHGLRVALLDEEFLEYATSDKRQKQASDVSTRVHENVMLRGKRDSFRIGSRSCPDDSFERQLDVNGLLKVGQSIIPPDGCALLLLVDHDMYEDKTDDFICGLADPSTQVAVISIARYNPLFDSQLELDSNHFWPASHCQHHMRKLVAAATQIKVSKKKQSGDDRTCEKGGALEHAVKAYDRALECSSPHQQHAIWLSRICFIASHELAHCFGLDHCVYYACCMQGSDSRQEDYRQPPYLCPVDLQKILHLTGATVQARYETLLEFCDEWSSAPMFAAYAAWIRCNLQQ